MDSGGLSWVIIDVIAVILLGAGLLWGVMRVRSRGKETSNPTTERATDDLYREEEKRRREGTDDN